MHTTEPLHSHPVLIFETHRLARESGNAFATPERTPEAYQRPIGARDDGHTALVHVHPAAANPFLIFEIRRLARQSGCAFVTTKRTSQAYPRPIGPNDGGHAA